MEAEVFASGWRGVFFVVNTIALFTVDFSHCISISGNFAVFARNCLTSTFKYIIVQREKG